MAISTERYQGQVTNIAVPVMTAGTNEVLTISKALVTNSDASTAYLLTVYDDTTGGGAATANIVYGPQAISPKETKVLPLSALAIKSGGKLLVVADTTNKLNLSIAYSKTAQ